MIDIHSHILPGIDDGAKDLKQALEIARIYVKSGFKRVIATPHWIPGTSLMPEIQSVKEQVAILNQTFKNNDIGLTVFPGMEVGLDPDLPMFLDNGLVQTLAGKKHVLIETPFQRFPLGWDQVLFEIISRRQAVIMAHPERCSQLAEKPKLFDELIEAGAYLQINWGSLLGHAGPEAKEVARFLLKKGYVHCVATDSHDPEHRHPGHIKPAAAELVGIAGVENLKLLAGANPLRVLRGEPLEPMVRSEGVEKPKPRKKWWKIW